MNSANHLSKKDFLFNILHTLFKRKFFIIGLTLVTYFSFLFGTFLITPLWKGTALIMVEPNARHQIVLFDKMSAPAGQLTQINPLLNMVEVLSTKAVAGEVVKEFGLDERKRQRGLHPKGLRLRSKKLLVNILTSPMKIFSLIRGGTSGEKDFFSDAVEDFKKDAEDIKVISDTSVISISIWEESPRLAVDIANAMAEKMIDKTMNLTRGELQKAFEFVSGQVDKSEAKLAGAEKALRLFKEQSGVVSINTQTSAEIARLSSMETELAVARVSARETKERIKEVKGQIGDKKEIEVATSVIARNPHVDELKSAIIDKELKLAALLTEKTEEHPDVLNMKSSISEAKRSLKQEAEMILGSRTEKKNPLYEELQKRLIDLEIDSYALKSKMRGLKQAIDKIYNTLGEFPSKEERLAKLTREVSIESGVYENLKSKLEELNILKTTSIGEMRLSVIDKAYIPRGESPLWPKWFINIPVGLIVSLFLVLGLAFFLEYWDDTFRSLAELRRKTGRNVFGAIPLADEENKGGER